ncbi:hypothetical protein M408DRAFT_183049 [Serendipita vermifera MAFF 305830]|uniref:Uncharacterized protein n=1 Tax=Serendipita vermifera MAFF 305830 TaxID=933852 RepID=A0A0C3BM96_SERVB|nr:hypothetical protein M408DRAFT_183049 [Serendipita vermifera MAFF 305830]
MVVYSTQEDPPEIREKLEALQYQNNLVEELQFRLNAVQRERDRLEKEIDEYRMSAQSYIRKCPKEILMILFEFYTLENPRVVRRLLLVCKEWYQLAVSMPRLWNRIPINIDHVWDVTFSCNDISRRVEICLQRSGSLPLELDLDFTNFESSGAKICEKIIDSFQGSNADSWNIREWAYGLSTESIEGFEVLPVCHPQHVFALVEQLAGKTGDVMRRWGSLRLVLPGDGNLAAMVWKHLVYPTPHLSRMDLNGTHGLTLVHGNHDFVGFPDLRALRHLGLDDLEDLDSLRLEVSSLSSFVVRYVQGDISSLSRLANLHTLTLVGGYGVPSDVPVQQTTLSLPRLRNLSVQWVIEGIQDIQFNIPKLECFDIFCPFLRLPRKANYARIQTERLSWRFDEIGLSSNWEDKIKVKTSFSSEIRSILTSYPNTSYFTFSSTFKGVVIEILRESNVNSALSSALRAVTFEGSLGDLETVVAQEIWMPND